MLIYSLLKNITVRKGEVIDVGKILGKVELNKFPPKKYKEILSYKQNIYSVNISFHYINYETGKLVHLPNEAKIINCNRFICEKCQPIIYGLLQI